MTMTLLEGRKGKRVVVKVPAQQDLLLLSVHATTAVNLGRRLARVRWCVMNMAASFHTA